MIWQSRDQFVALTPQDYGTAGSRPLPNDHPAQLTAERLSEFLLSIDVRETAADKPVALFTPSSAQIVTPYLQQAFNQATPGEDVTFAVIGLHTSLFGFAKSPKVTTGRIFYQGGVLNLILGLVQKDVNEREDRRLSPFTPGSRVKTSQGEWTLQPRTGQATFALLRRDWLKSVPALPLPAELPPPEKMSPLSAAPPPVPKAVSLPTMTPAPVLQAPKAVDARGPAERLLLLTELKDRGLIKEEEYVSKRAEILKGL